MLQHTTLQFRRVSLWAIAGAFALATVVPVLLPQFALAAPSLTERELQSSSARAGQATNLTWVFDTTADAANVEYIQIEFCDTPLSACSNAKGDDDTGTDNIPVLPGSITATIGGSGGWNNPANAATQEDGYNNGGTAGDQNQIDIDITTGFAGASANESSIAINGFTNDAAQNTSYYTRVRMYNNDAHAPGNLVWEGVFAQSTSQTLTVNARVQERLDFCVGATGINDGTTTPTPTLGDCRDISGSTVDIGNIESGFLNVSPVGVSEGGSNTNGIAMVRTNAVNGIVVDYKAIQNSSSGSLKVAGATCGSTVYASGSSTDQCFNSRGTTQGTFTTGTEGFGMTIAAVNCVSTTAYTCAFGSGTYNLLRDGDYDGTGGNTYVGDTGQVPTSSIGYAWDDTGAADRIASSAGSTVKVVDDEALIMKFAATAGITTPTGSYSVQADYIATATF